MNYLLYAFVFSQVLFIGAFGKEFCRCDLAAELLNIHGISRTTLPIWICIAEQVSNYSTTYLREKQNGLFGILDGWCAVDSYGGNCAMLCSDLRNDVISDDIICAQAMFRYYQKTSGNGFNGWDTYKSYCKNVTNINRYIDDCFASKPQQNCNLKPV